MTSIHPDRHPSAVSQATGAQWVIGHGDQRAVICEVGATLRSYTVAGREVVDGFGDDEWSRGGRGQVLAPWPNRLEGGRYAFEGRDAQAALDEPERRNAIHGLVRWLSWELLGRAQNRVELGIMLHPTPGYPFPLDLRADYHLGRDGLTVTARAINPGGSPVPFGIGFHPYVAMAGIPVDEQELTVPAEARVVADERGIPTGTAGVVGTPYDFWRARPIGIAQLDTCFTGLSRDETGVARVTLRGRELSTAVWMDAAFGYVMVYTGDTLPEPERRRSVAIEPMSCAPNAFNSGEGLVALGPGAAWQGAWGIAPSVGA